MIAQRTPWAARSGSGPWSLLSETIGIWRQLLEKASKHGLRVAAAGECTRGVTSFCHRTCASRCGRIVHALRSMDCVPSAPGDGKGSHDLKRNPTVVHHIHTRATLQRMALSHPKRHLAQGAHCALCPRCAKSRLFSTTSSHGSQGPEFCTLPPPCWYTRDFFF